MRLLLAPAPPALDVEALFAAEEEEGAEREGTPSTSRKLAILSLVVLEEDDDALLLEVPLEAPVPRVAAGDKLGPETEKLGDACAGAAPTFALSMAA